MQDLFGLRGVCHTPHPFRLHHRCLVGAFRFKRSLEVGNWGAISLSHQQGRPWHGCSLAQWSAGIGMDQQVKVWVPLLHRLCPNPKLTQTEVGELRVKFEANYPGELICDQSMPSLIPSYQHWSIWKILTPTSGSLGNPGCQNRYKLSLTNPDHHVLIVNCFGLLWTWKIYEPPLMNSLSTASVSLRHLTNHRIIWWIQRTYLPWSDSTASSSKWHWLSLVILPFDLPHYKKLQIEVFGDASLQWNVRTNGAWMALMRLHIVDRNFKAFSNLGYLLQVASPSHPGVKITVPTQRWKRWRLLRLTRWNLRTHGSASSLGKGFAFASISINSSQVTSVANYTFVLFLILCGGKHSAKNHKKSPHWLTPPPSADVDCMLTTVDQRIHSGPPEFKQGSLPTSFPFETAQAPCKTTCLFCPKWTFMWLHRTYWQNQRTCSWHPQRWSFWSSFETRIIR